VIVDPLAQMAQKINQIRRGTGGAASTDFLPLVATFGEAWDALPVSEGVPASASTASQASNPILGLDYRDGLLTVRFKPGVNPPKEAAQIELAARNVSLTVLPEQGDAVVWQIRSVQ